MPLRLFATRHKWITSSTHLLCSVTGVAQQQSLPRWTSRSPPTPRVSLAPMTINPAHDMELVMAAVLADRFVSITSADIRPFVQFTCAASHFTASLRRHHHFLSVFSFLAGFPHQHQRNACTDLLDAQSVPTLPRARQRAPSDPPTNELQHSNQPEPTNHQAKQSKRSKQASKQAAAPRERECLPQRQRQRQQLGREGRKEEGRKKVHRPTLPRNSTTTTTTTTTSFVAAPLCVCVCVSV